MTVNSGLLNGTTLNGYAAASWVSRGAAIALAAAVAIAAPDKTAYAEAFAETSSALVIVDQRPLTGLNGRMINGMGINGGAIAAWVSRGFASADAGATGEATPQRTAYTTAYGDAGVTVTLTDTHVIAARASNSAGATYALFPTLEAAGRSFAVGQATGNAAVRRDIYGFASNDATATGIALAVDALGEAELYASATVVDASAHIISPARSLVVGQAQGECAGDVTRYVACNTVAGSFDAYAEGSIKINGSSIWLLDGFVRNANGTATVAVDPERVITIATLGSFAFGESSGAANTFIRFTTRSVGTGTMSGVATPLRIFAGEAAGYAEATALVESERAKFGSAFAEAGATHFTLKPNVNYRASSTGQADATLTIAIPPVRNRYGHSYAMGEARLVSSTFGSQYPALASATAGASVVSIGEPSYVLGGSGTGTATAYLVASVFGTQHRANANDTAVASSELVDAVTDFAGQALSASEATGSATYATQHYAGAVVTCGAVGDARTAKQHYANVLDAGRATASLTPIRTTFGRVSGQVGGMLDLQALPIIIYMGYVDVDCVATGSAVWKETSAGPAIGLASATGYAIGKNASAGPVFGQATASGVAIGITNSEKPAPETRAMQVSREDRGMLVPFEDRVMRVSP